MDQSLVVATPPRRTSALAVLGFAFATVAWLPVVGVPLGFVAALFASLGLRRGRPSRRLAVAALTAALALSLGQLAGWALLLIAR